MKDLFNAVQLSHRLVEQHMRAGMTAVDATCGNGNDTLFLARIAGHNGRVFSFDIQPEALETARLRAEKERMENICYILDGHEHMAAHVTPGIDCAVFNLGYLPSSQSKVITKAGTSRLAFKAALNLLNPGGIIVVCAYVSHQGGMHEYRVLKRMLRRLDAAKYRTMVFDQPNRRKYAPKVFFVRK